MELSSERITEINSEFRRLHELIVQLQSDIAEGLSRERFLQAQIDTLQGQEITLREQMAIDFQKIAEQKIRIGELYRQLDLAEIK